MILETVNGKTYQYLEPSDRYYIEEQYNGMYYIYLDSDLIEIFSTAKKLSEWLSTV